MPATRVAATVRTNRSAFFGMPRVLYVYSLSLSTVCHDASGSEGEKGEVRQLKIEHPPMEVTVLGQNLFPCHSQPAFHNAQSLSLNMSGSGLE